MSLHVTLPADHPITGVRTSQRPGWTATMTRPLDPPIERHGRTITEAVTTVTWTADPGVRIGPGEFADFPLSLGPLPTDTDTSAPRRPDLRRRRGRVVGPATRR